MRVLCPPLWGSLGVAIALLACTACDSLGSFEMNEESDEIVVQGNPLGNLANLFPARIPMTVNLDQELAARDAGPAESVHLIALELVITDTHDPDGSDDFDFLENVLIRVESTESGASLPREDLAWRSDIPRGQRRVQLEVDDSIDLKPYIEEGIRLRSTVGGSPPGDTVSLKAIATFRVHLL